MPFTLAHPAAIWPIRRLPTLSLIPLVLGSLLPDIAGFIPHNVLMPYYWLPNSHTLRATFTFDLPLGYLLLLLLITLRTPLTAPLWEPHRSFIRSGFTRLLTTRHWWLISVPSLLIGSWTHIVWDSFTHENHWMVRNVPLLQQQVAEQIHPMGLYHVLQYVCSVVGLVIVIAWYAAALKQSGFVGTGHRWRKYTLAALVGGALLIGAAKAWHSPAAQAFWFYGTMSVLLNTAMVVFVAAYFVTGTIIALRMRRPVSAYIND